ncbi:hypothetical protein B0H13DRAFT_2010505 [Mycena leptocephala]|nr:hypothetical protein B0H13DRAFT_2010505 [Mycena leptocephala]
MESVEDLRVRLEEISSAMEHHEAAIRDLAKAKSDVQGRLNTIRDPITRLPLEISSSIFILCLSSTTSSSPSEAPLLFLRVCHSWNAITRSVPALWATLHIKSPRRNGFPILFDAWLNRAQGLLLSLSIRGSLEGDQFVAGLVKRHASRWQNLELHLLSGDELKEITTPFVSLKSLTIAQGTDSGPERYSSGGDSHYSRSPIECVQMICAAPNLVECTFIDISYKRTHLHLKHLHLGLEGYHASPLETLFMPFFDIGQPDFVAFLTRSSPPLRSLRLFISTYNDLDLSFAEHTEETHVYTAFSPSLVIIHSLRDLTLLPNLRNLTSRRYTPDRSDYEKLVEVLVARSSSPSKMHSFRFLWTPKIKSVSEQQRERLRGNLRREFPDAHIIQAMQALVADGMEIHIGPEGNNFI